MKIARSTDALPTRADYPGQKWIAQRHEHGRIPTRGTYDHLASEEEVLKECGPGHWWFKKCKPRFFLEWEAFLGDPDDIDGCECLESSESVSPKKAESPDYASLKKKTDILIPVVAATAAGEILGFGLTALTLAGLGQRLNRAETILQAYSNINPIQFNCGVCGKPLDDLFGKYCGKCRADLRWTDKPTLNVTGARCPKCQCNVRPGQFYCTQCGQPLFALVPETEVPKWRLP